MKDLLKDYPSEKVNIYIAYFNELATEKDKDGKLKNAWVKRISKEKFAEVFKKVADSGMYIDGDTITLAYRKKIVVTYDYHAYQNRILLSYPETQFDFGVVHKGDTFTVRKENGKVIYKHDISDPFNTDREIVGAYGVIRNTKGEFVETINLKDIEKMRKSSKMTYIWDAWFDRMVLKSVIKRICSVHFKDIVKDIETVDNEQNDPDRAVLPQNLIDAIDNAETIEQLGKIYNTSKKGLNAEQEKIFIKLLNERKKEIK